MVPEFGRVGWGFVVGWNPGADGLPWRFDGLEGLIRPPHLAGSPCGLRLSPASKTPPLPRCFSISKGGSGGGGRLMRASQRPRRRRKNSTSPRRTIVSTRFIVPWQLGHLRGLAPQTLRMRSRQSGRMARAVAFGGAGMRRTSDSKFEIGDLRSGEEGSGGAGTRAAAGLAMPRDLLE